MQRNHHNPVFNLAIVCKSCACIVAERCFAGGASSHAGVPQGNRGQHLRFSNRKSSCPLTLLTTHSRVYPHTHTPTHGWSVGRAVAWFGRVDGWMDGWLDGWMDVRTHARMYACLYAGWLVRPGRLVWLVGWSVGSLVRSLVWLFVCLSLCRPVFG